MKTLPKAVALVATVHLLFLSAGLAAEERTEPGIALALDAARPTALTLNGKKVSLSGEGGFRIYDATAKKNIILPQGALTQVAGGTAFDCKGSDVRCAARVCRSLFALFADRLSAGFRQGGSFPQPG